MKRIASLMFAGAVSTVIGLNIGWRIMPPMRIDSSESFDVDGIVRLNVNGRRYRLTPQEARDIAAGLVATADSAEAN